MIVFQRLVIPAEAGIQSFFGSDSVFTGMTDKDRAFFKALKCYK